ncbi:MAG: FAD-dependent oxidoreductase [Pseudomonadota bacterium]
MTGVIIGCWQDTVLDNRGPGQPPSTDRFSFPVEFESGNRIMAFIGWDGFFIFDENVPVIEMMRAYVEKAQEESCGNCTPCRVGTRIIADKLRGIIEGRGRMEDLELIGALARAIRDASMCELGHTSMVPLLKLMDLMPEALREAVTGGSRERSGALRYHAIVTSPCAEACPAHLDIPSYIDAIRSGNYYESLSIIARRNPLAGICGRVCVRPCELTCRRAELDDPVSIKHLKRFVNDQILSYAATRSKRPEAAPDTSDKTVAVIGAGPCGLTAAFHLKQKGYGVDVFEELSEPGGMSAVGIPDYRLPREVISAEVRRIEGTGVRFHYGVRIGRDRSLRDLRRDYDAVLVGIGAHVSKNIGMAGEEEKPSGYVPGVKFLREINLLHHRGEFIRPEGSRVVIIGGGNVAMDCARSAKRLGYPDVRVVYRRTETEMPAEEEEVAAAKQEGVAFDFLTHPVRLEIEEGRVTGLTCVRMKLGDIDASGRRRPVAMEGSDFPLDCDIVIPAIGQAADFTLFTDDFPIKTTRWGTIAVDEESMMTSQDGVFAGGDSVSGPKALIDAMGHGLHAAHCMDQYLRGGKMSMPEHERMFRLLSAMNLTKSAMDRVGMKFRQHLDVRPVEERIADFQEIETGYKPEEAIREAERCLRCCRIAMFVTER